MSGRTSPVNGEAGGAGSVRLSVRKDLFPRGPPEPSQSPEPPAGASALEMHFADVHAVKLETDFEQSIDEIAQQRLRAVNGVPKRERSRGRHRKHRTRDRDRDKHNGCLPKTKKRKSSVHESRPHRTSSHRDAKVKGGKNLSLVSSSEFPDDDDDDDDEDYKEEEEEEEESSEDEVLNVCRMKLPIINMPRPSGKPYSHELSQLSTKKSKRKSKESKKQRSYVATPCSGKPRSMLEICSSKSKKKSKKSRTIVEEKFKKSRTTVEEKINKSRLVVEECSQDSSSTYHSQIMDTNTTIKIKIRRGSIHEVVPPPPIAVADIGQRKSKKKRSASPVASESSGEEYDPSRGDTAAAVSVAAPKPRHHSNTKRIRQTTAKVKNKSERTEAKPTAYANVVREAGPQSPWGESMPEEILIKIFEHVVTSQGTLPTVIRLGRVCKLWHAVSCRPELWTHVDLAQHTAERCKTDFKLQWLLENRLSRCHSLNISHWKVVNTAWVVACLADYSPQLVELSVAGWSRLTAEQLHDIFRALPKLQRIDLSLTSETGGSGTCLTAASVARVVEDFGARLTHLTLANNKFSALQQILTSIATHCPNLEVLDISGARATSHPAAVPLEALQAGCPKVRVFRAANAQLVLTNASTAQQMEAAGWSCLEELSIAGSPEDERYVASVAVGSYRLGEEALARLVRGATRLRLLDLRGLPALTDSGLVRVPAWDLQHLFLGGCNVTRQKSACLDLICEKWSHSLLELDLSWASAARALDDAVRALADAHDSRLRTLNLCGSAVTLEPLKKLLQRCRCIQSLNLSSCRALPRGMKRLYTGKELQDLKDSFDPEKIKLKQEREAAEKKDEKKTEATETTKESPESTDSCSTKGNESSCVFQEPKSVADSDVTRAKQASPDSKSIESVSKDSELGSPSHGTLASPAPAPAPAPAPVGRYKPDSSSTPRAEGEGGKLDASPDVAAGSVRGGSSWSLGQFKGRPAHQSEASPSGRRAERCSPTTSQQDTRPSPEAHAKPDAKSNSWNYGSYSPMPRQDGHSSQRSPYSAQPSPAQPSPYSAQPSPYSAQRSPYSSQPSPYSAQPSPYSAQPSPDTSHMAKPDQKQPGWNAGAYSPLTKHVAPYSPLPSAPDRSPYSPLPAGGTAVSAGAGQSPYSPAPVAGAGQSPYSPAPVAVAGAGQSPYSPAPVAVAGAGQSPYSPAPVAVAGQSPYSPAPGAGQSPYSPAPVAGAGGAGQSPYSPLPSAGTGHSPFSSLQAGGGAGSGRSPEASRAGKRATGTPSGYSPLRAERVRRSPYSPRARVTSRSPAAAAAGAAPPCPPPAPAPAPSAAGAVDAALRPDVFAHAPPPPPPPDAANADLPSNWNIEKFNQMGGAAALESLLWQYPGAASLELPPALQGPAWPDPGGGGGGGGGGADPWGLGGGGGEAALSLEALAAHVPSFLDDSFSGSRVD